MRHYVSKGTFTCCMHVLVYTWLLISLMPCISTPQAIVLQYSKPHSVILQPPGKKIQDKAKVLLALKENTQFDNKDGADGARPVKHSKRKEKKEPDERYIFLYQSGEGMGSWRHSIIELANLAKQTG